MFFFSIQKVLLNLRTFNAKGQEILKIVHFLYQIYICKVTMGKSQKVVLTIGYKRILWFSYYQRDVVMHIKSELGGVSKPIQRATILYFIKKKKIWFKLLLN